MSRELTRRTFVTATALGVAGCDAAVSAVAGWLEGGLPASFETPSGASVEPDLHLLRRATFGPRPGDLEALRSMGREAWLDAQLDPRALDDTACDLRVGVIDTLHVEAGLSFEFPPEQIESELVAGALVRATCSKRQLLEVITEVWTDHFHVAIGKGRCRHLRSPYDREALRAHALGSFRELLGAVTKSAAMLVYLDGASNERAARPNENHARELLELHTLGVDGGYTQTDIQEVARCLTGFVVDEGGARPGGVRFVPERHDDGGKRVLGETIAPGGGASDVERVLDIVASHPKTAVRVARTLCRAFIADDPPEDVVLRATAVFTRTGGHIADVVRAVLLDSGDAASARIKRPFRFVVSALRALGAEPRPRDLATTLARMGHAPFAWPTPDGYPTRGEAWLGTLVERFRFALALVGPVEAELAQIRDGAGGEAPLLAHLLGRKATDVERDAFARAPDLPGRVALGLASPAFQRF